MVRKSYGKMRGSRYKLQVKKIAITGFLQQFKVGDRVKIDFVSHQIPNPKFQGLTGLVVETKGSAYGVEVRDGGKPKIIYLNPEHLKK